jgi:hypothetical protein
MGDNLQINARTSSDRVRECRGGCGRDRNGGSKTLPATTFYMTWSI